MSAVVPATSTTTASRSAYFSASISSMSACTPGGGTTTVRMIPRSAASLSSRDTRACERWSWAAISGCRTPFSW